MLYYFCNDCGFAHRKCKGSLDKKSLKEISEKLTDIKEKISLAMDTCCFASVDLDYDEFDKLTRDLEDVLESLGKTGE